ncbi:MAG: sterol carrier protein [Armatimonadetes bacterium CG07_land_8_20_14_0_80_40_9]|nr:MAG: sterol carrier protein [Armatimonadetes bacterium CG07_land_8_20_14_0_80_40_9]
MGYFKDTEEFYSILEPFFNKLKDDPKIGPKVVASGLVIQFQYSEPEAILTIDCPNNKVIAGECEIKPDVEMSMKSDTAHRFWLGKVNLMMALTKGEMKAKGPIPKIMKLLPIIKGAYAMYKDYLKEKGYEELANVA